MFMKRDKKGAFAFLSVIPGRESASAFALAVLVCHSRRESAVHLALIDNQKQKSALKTQQLAAS
jgi:hypothetical protein